MGFGWPLWTAIAGMVALCLYSARLLWHYWNKRLIADANRSLQLPVPAFVLLGRQQIIDRLLGNPQLQQVIRQQAAATGVDVAVLKKRCRRHAGEMVPAFKAAFYFRVGYWLAKALLLSHYHAHSRLTDTAALDNLDANASVVLVLNHRSNMDVLLINFLASQRSTLMHAAGEWARLWPLHHLVRMAGNYVVDRDARDPLYGSLLKAYVQMATSEGAHLAIFPEGELTRDGKMQTPKFGLLSYIARAGEQAASSEVHFIPVAVNYDYVPEENALVFDDQASFRTHGKRHLFIASVFATVKMTYRVLRRRRAQFGHACASFGQPLSLRAWRAAHGSELPDADDKQWVSQLGGELMREVARLVPALPTHALAAELVASPDSLWTTDEIKLAMKNALATLRGAGAAVFIPEIEESRAIDAALQRLVERGLLLRDTTDRYRANPAQLPVLRYLANSIAHLHDGQGGRTGSDLLLKPGVK